MVVATGFFDGVHIGHRHVIDRLVSAAHERGTDSVVVTFWPHPRNVLQNGARGLRLLSSLQEKKDMLLSLGVVRVEVLNFTKEFSQLTTEEYLRGYVMDRFGGTAILLGYDNRMGRDAGSADDIADTARSLGLEVIRTDGVVSSGVTVSSTKIREALASGNVCQASEMLGYCYHLHGVVIEGNRLGRTIGFPTANMQLYEPLKLIPANGVYLVKVETLGRTWHGMTNIGTRPTVTGVSASDVNSDRMRTIETHIFGFDEDIYGLDISVTFLSKIRDERLFSSLDGLKRQLMQDRDACMAILGQSG